jgi:hypothetical protein
MPTRLRVRCSPCHAGIQSQQQLACTWCICRACFSHGAGTTASSSLQTSAACVMVRTLAALHLLHAPAWYMVRSTVAHFAMVSCNWRKATCLSTPYSSMLAARRWSCCCTSFLTACRCCIRAGYEGLRSQVGSKPSKAAPVDPADRIFSSSSSSTAVR